MSLLLAEERTFGPQLSMSVLHPTADIAANTLNVRRSSEPVKSAEAYLDERGARVSKKDRPAPGASALRLQFVLRPGFEIAGVMAFA